VNDADTGSTHRRNAALNIAGEALWGFQMGLVAVATVLPVLLRRFGAGETMVASIGTIAAAGMLLPQFAGLYIFTSLRRRKQQLLTWHFIAIIPFLFLTSLLIVLSGKLSDATVRWGLLALFCAMQFAGGAVMAAWMDWIAHLFPTTRRGTVMGAAFSASAMLGVGGSLLAGRLIAARPGVQTYALLYFVAGLIASVSIAVFWLVRCPAANAAERPRPALHELIGRFRHSLSDRNFRAFLIGRILATGGFCVMPLMAVFYMSAAGGGLSESQVVSYGAALTAGTGLANLALGRLGDRFGHRLGILTGTAMQVGVLLVMLLTAGPISCIIAYAGAGICTAAGFVSHYNLVFETCPHDNRMVHITAANFVVGVFTMSAPLLAGALATALGMRALFAGCLVLSLAALAWVALQVKDPRTLAPVGARDAVPRPTPAEGDLNA